MKKSTNWKTQNKKTTRVCFAIHEKTAKQRMHGKENKNAKRPKEAHNDRAWEDLKGFERTWKDLKGFERTWKDLIGLERTWKGLKGLGMNWMDWKGLERTWKNWKKCKILKSVTEDRQTEWLTMPVLERHAPLKNEFGSIL